MQAGLMIAISIHVLAGVFWAGSAFAIARSGGAGAERLFVPQMLAALTVIVSGGFLWSTLHQGEVGPMERSLEVGIVCALLALAIQILVVRPALRSGAGGETARPRAMVASRFVALLLAATTIAMAAARYA